jgi:hypothetical protein
MLPPFFGGNHCQPGCTHPSSEVASPESMGGFLAKYWAVGPGPSPLIMASMTISLGTVGACALRRKNLRTYAWRYSS